jgi:serine/threonine protein phosphatase 1
MTRPIVAVADLHGQRTLFDALVTTLDQELGADYTLVPLGDYVDNGPEIPALLDRLLKLREQRGERFVPIMGNHDLACLLSMGWNGGPPSKAWYQRWAQRYWNPGLGTPHAYGVRSGEELALKMPPSHRAFLQSLPWFHESGAYIFVHAGLHAGPVAPQLEELARREPRPETFLHDQLREKKLATVSDPGWGKVVVSGHTHNPPGGRPHFVTEHRITLSSDADHDGVLWAVALPERRFYKVDPFGTVTSGTDTSGLS